MTVRTYVHAVTGREIKVLEGTRASRLVEADDNYSEVKPTRKKEAGDGSGNAGGRGSGTRKGSQRTRTGEAS